MTQSNTRIIKLCLDFETYWDSRNYTLRKMSTPAYILDDRFHAHGAAVRVGDNATQWVTGDKLEAFVKAVPWHRTALIGWNLAFDASILAWVYGVTPRFNIDVMGVARAMLGNSVENFKLDTVSAAMGFGGKKDYASFSATDGVERLTPVQERALVPYALGDVDDTLAIYNALRGGFPTALYPLLDWSIRCCTQPQLHLDEAVLRKAHVDELARRDAIIDSMGVALTSLRSNPQFAELLAGLDIEPPMKLSKKTGQMTYAFSKTDIEFADLLDDEDENVAALVAARLAVKGSLAETRAKGMADLAAVTGGSMPCILNFSGAVQTHRLSGGGSLNVQNLSRGSQLRAGIIAPPDMALVAIDSSQIELRIAALLVGEAKLVRTLDEGGDPYCVFASELYGREVTKADTLERQTSKVFVLGAGYAAGGAAMRRMLRAQAGVRKTEEEAQEIVDVYRTTFRAYPAAWDGLKRVLADWAKGHEAHGFPLALPACMGVARGTITGPSALVLRYPDVRQEKHTFEKSGTARYVYTMASQNKKKSFVSTLDGTRRTLLHGGTLLENVCQHLAACIINEIMMRVAHRTGYRAALQVHDELLYVVPANKADAFLRVLAGAHDEGVPWWNIVLACEGGVGANYLSLRKGKVS